MASDGRVRWPEHPDAGAVGSQVRALVEAVAGVAAADPAMLPGEVALAEVSVILSLESQLAATRLARLADLDARDLAVLAGASSTGAWLEDQPVPAPRQQLTLARRLHAMPHVAEAVQSGRLALRTAEIVGAALTRTARLVDRADGLIDGHDGEAVIANLLLRGIVQTVSEAHGGFDDDDAVFDALLEQLLALTLSSTSQQDRLERAFVLLAAHVPANLLRDALDRLVDALRSHELEDSAERAHDRRGLSLTLDSDGAGYTLGRSRLTLELGEALRAVIDAELVTDPDNLVDTAAWRAQHGADPMPAKDVKDTTEAAGDPAGMLVLPLPPRSMPQRRHDALRRGLRRLLDSGALGTRDKVAPHCAVIVNLDALNEVPGALPAVSRLTGTRLPLSLVRSLMCDSRITRLVMTLRGRVREVSHTERTARAHERLEIGARWGHRCAEKHCPSPPGTPLIPHHGTSWASTGVTSVDDQVPLCDHSHDDVHVRGRILVLRDGRRLGPGGWVTDHTRIA